MTLWRLIIYIGGGGIAVFSLIFGLVPLMRHHFRKPHEPLDDCCAEEGRSISWDASVERDG